MSNNDAYEQETERREYRHRRRVRNQIIAYIVTAIIVIGLMIGAVFGIKKLMSVVEDKKHAEELQQQLEELSEMEVEAPVIEAPAEEPEQEEQVEEKSYLDEIVDSCIAEMPIEDKVAGLFVITPEALTDTTLAIRAGDTTKEKLGEYAVGGLIYFSENMQSAEQLREMLQNTRSYSKYPIFLGVDEEGGDVSRVAKSGLADNVGKAADIGASGDPQNAKDAGVTVGTYLAEYGFNLNFAPVADVNVAEDSYIGNRSYGSDAGQIGAMVAAAVEGTQSTGVSACLKHFPGLGSTTEDTHAGMAGSERTFDEFAQEEFTVFKAGIDAGAATVMAAFNDVNGVPCSGNKYLLRDVLREKLGFSGFVVSDANSVMELIPHGYAKDGKDAARLAFGGGVDMLMAGDLYNDNIPALIDEGKIDPKLVDDSVLTILTLKYMLGLFEEPYVEPDGEGCFFAPEHLEAARECAKNCIVLLENNGALCCGKNLYDAEALSMVLEKNARSFLVGQLFPEHPIQTVSREECEKMREFYLQSYSKRF